MINEIKKRLEAGEVVELECIDRDGFINHNESEAMEANKNILNQSKITAKAVIGTTSVHLNEAPLVGYSNSLFLEELQYFKIKEAKDEVDALIQSRSNGSYNGISDDMTAIMRILGLDSDRSYSLYQIIHKVVRIKYGYSVEDSLLDIAGYAKLELERLRNEKNQ